MSNLEQQIADMLEGEGIDYEREKPLKYMAGWRYYDFCLIDYNVLIEVDGQYYHDTRGKPSYVIMMAKKNDAIKNWLAKKEGYNLIRIKEKELLEEYDGVKEKISLLVGKENL
jgi:very-short-patch-repair endonuclease|tara:strand:- start:619 stop:957 length:339 start_codon:yes stop_codon:yes gene_type:complete